MDRASERDHGGLARRPGRHAARLIYVLPMPTTVTSTIRTVFGTSSTNVYVGGDNGLVLQGTQ